MIKADVAPQNEKHLVTIWTPWGEQLVPRRNSRLEAIRRLMRRIKTAKPDVDQERRQLQS